VRVLVTPSIRQFPLHFPSRASPCATTFRTQYTSEQDFLFVVSLKSSVALSVRRPQYAITGVTSYVVSIYVVS